MFLIESTILQFVFDTIPLVNEMSIINSRVIYNHQVFKWNKNNLLAVHIENARVSKPREMLRDKGWNLPCITQPLDEA